MKRPAEALAAFDEALRLDPALPLHANRAQALLGVGRVRDALGAFARNLRSRQLYVPPPPDWEEALEPGSELGRLSRPPAIW
jgi:tetratricopeptide (TPR) repeat protein